MTSLNEHAWRKFEEAAEQWERLGIAVDRSACGAKLIDAGVHASGGLAAGLAIAEIGMAGLGTSSLAPDLNGARSGLSVATMSDHPLEACYLGQAAHWPVKIGAFHAMGSGPACLLNPDLNVGRAFGFEEKSDCAVLVLESAALPGDEICRALADLLRVRPARLAIITAPTASLAGSAQIAARSVETGLHKLHHLGFDLRCATSAVAYCPLAVPAGDDLTALGRTNDAIIYGSRFWLFTRGISDEALERWAARLPSETSPIYGEPFLRILQTAGEFYNIDPGLFAPAEATLANLESGRSFHAGGVDLMRLEAALKG